MKTLLVLALLAIPAAAQTSFVHTDGTRIVTPSGQPVLLRGINLGNWLVPEGYMFHFEKGPASGREIDDLFSELIGPSAAREFWREWRRTYITEADIQFIKASGFNSVRVPFHYKLFTGPEGFQIMDPLIAWCRKAGLWVVLDMHCAPGGQTGTNIDDSYSYPWLFESEADQKEAAAIWRAIAQHYKEEPAVLGYDLLNEPIPHFPQVQKYNDRLEPLYRRIVAAVREVDPNHIVILGGAQWDTNFKVFGEPFDKNAIYTFHKYWMPPTRDAIAEYIAFRDRYKVPVWLGESGENTDDWIAKFAALLEENQIGWCFWPYKKMDATSSLASFNRPPHWDQILAFAKLRTGTGEAEERIKLRPPIDQTNEALAALLNNIQFKNCRPNPGYLKAMIH